MANVIRHIEVVQVTKRSDDGFISEWYANQTVQRFDTPENIALARADRRQLAKEFPSTEYAVLRVTMEEIG
jgi:hypothetical protein